MSCTRWTGFCTALFLIVTATDAQESLSPDPLFQSTDVLHVQIVAPLATLLRERSIDEQLPATFRYSDSAGQAVEFDVQIRVRGRFRLQKDVCAFPPMRLNFKESETRGTLFHKQDKVKLVTHCQPSSKYEQVILREYTAYRILNILTDASFRVRLLRITYVDSEGKKRDNVAHGFIIEHKDRLAKRLQNSYLDLPVTTVGDLEPNYASTVSLYHFLIGNTDFSPVRGVPGESCCHNHVLFGNESELIWSVPYDFDQAGIVNAPHAVPSERFRLRSVTQRLYRGRCHHNDLLDETIARYNDKREEIMAVLREVEGASNRSEKTMVKYVDKFYDTINSDRRVKGEIVKRCI